MRCKMIRKMIKYDTQMDERQEKIVKILKRHPNIGIAKIIEKLDSDAEKPSKISIIRDLNELISNGLVIRSGVGKAIVYAISQNHNIIANYDVEEYFQNLPESRNAQKTFNFDIFDLLSNTEILTQDEITFLEELNSEFQINFKGLSDSIIKKEFERLTIELSWKSSVIEGNTYSLLETENLIKEGIEAQGKSREESVMILNHKKTLEFIRENKDIFKDLKWNSIEKIHEILVSNLNVGKGVRKNLVGIIGTDYKPLDNEYQIKEALEKTFTLLNKLQNAFAKSLIFMLLISYIQPFEDGNKRTSRLGGNAILLANNIFPISFRSINEVEYKKAVLLFYEQNNISYFKKLFIEQAEFSAKNYFRNKIS